MRRPALARNDWLVLAILMVAAAIVALVAQAMRPPERAGGGIIEVPSSFFNDRAGAKALYLTWRRMGYDVDRIRRPCTPATLDGYSGVLVLRPRMAVSREEREALLRWVAEGRTLVLAPTPWGSFSDWVTMSDHETGPAPLERDEDAERVDVKRGRELAAADPLLEGVEALRTRRQLRFAKDPPADSPFEDAKAETPWQEPEGAAILRLRHGRGQVLMLGDLHPLSNVGLDEADNPLLAANLAAELAGPDGAGRIGFDEFHHGFAQRDASGVAIVKMILSHGRGWSVAQGLLAGVLALLLAAVTYGAPRDLRQVRRRRETEFVEAAGRLLQEARGGTGLATAIVYRGLRERLCRATHLPGSVEDEALAEAVARRCGRDLSHELQLGRHAASGGPIREPQLREMTRGMQSALEALERGSP